MFVLHVSIKVKFGEEQALEQVFCGPFSKAITTQEGFRSVSLLRPDGGGEYLLSITFEAQSFQQKWIATELHNEVWPMMEAYFLNYSLKTYTAV